MGNRSMLGYLKDQGPPVEYLEERVLGQNHAWCVVEVRCGFQLCRGNVKMALFQLVENQLQLNC